MIYYKDDEIEIRDIIHEDIISLFSWWIDKEINEHDPRPVSCNSKDLVEECNRYCSRFDNEVINENILERKYKYFIIVNSHDYPIGFVNFFNIEEKEKQGEMGVVVGDKRYWKKGIAYKATDIVINHIFRNMSINRIYIETAETNLPSLKLFRKLHFKKCDEYFETGEIKFIVMDRHK